jgi:hypothetical protein
MIDLHTHSTMSDGTLAPAELARAAAGAGLHAVALTDHDTLAGLEEFHEAARAAGVTAVSGVEMCASWYAGSMHILGLFLHPPHQALDRLLVGIRDNREKRNALIIAKLKALGLEVSYAEATALAGGDVMGRLHIAKALVSRGDCKDLAEAFDRYLGGGKPAYVRRFLPLPEELIHTIHEAGGVAVWAHPLAQVRTSPAKLRQTARFLKDLGLDAMEVHYPEFTPQETETAAAIAAQVGLLASGGSDFHGEHSPGISLGTGRGTLHVPDDLLAALLARAKTYRTRRTV